MYNMSGIIKKEKYGREYYEIEVGLLLSHGAFESLHDIEHISTIIEVSKEYPIIAITDVDFSNFCLVKNNRIKEIIESNYLLTIEELNSGDYNLNEDFDDDNIIIVINPKKVITLN